MSNILKKYAQLLVNYCLETQPGDKFFIQTTLLAEPLVREVFREATRKGAHVEVNMAFLGQDRIFMEEAQDMQLEYVSPFRKQMVEEFNCYLYIRAPFNTAEEQGVDAEKRAKRGAATKGINDTYFARTATRALKRNLCQFPTLASAQLAGMSLEAYEKFVFGACNLFDDDPQQSWLDRRKSQQKIVDLLNGRETVRYVTEGTDITFSTKGRTWINSDGQTNMPSGEVYTSPVENSVNGQVYFSYPSLHGGHDIEGVRLTVKDGYIEKWEAQRGKEYLDKIFAMPGTRRFGEAAIGTNYNIQQTTKNILFDEKIGGTVHMAIGQSYGQCGGKNESAVHWDMITEMKNGGRIFADEELIYEDGEFRF